MSPVVHEGNEEQREHHHVAEDEQPDSGLPRQMPFGLARGSNSGSRHFVYFEEKEMGKLLWFQRLLLDGLHQVNRHGKEPYAENRGRYPERQ
jgi:hypothetical protein